MRVRAIGVVAGCLLAVLGGPQAAGGSTPSPLTGTIRVKDFTVPRGTTRLLSGNLRLFASRNITIDGTLLIEGEHKLRLVAGKALRIARTGRIMAAPDLLASASSPPQVMSLPQLLQLQGGKLVEIGSKMINVPPGYSIKVATADVGTIRLSSAGLGTEDGRASPSPGLDGQSGGSIILGGLFGPDERIELIGSTIRAGDGGDGFSSKAGTQHGGLNPCQANPSSQAGRGILESRGSDGGKGGTVRLLAKHIVNKHSIAFVGNGGKGGNADVAAPAGAAGHGGDDVLAWSGSGGEGGGIVIEGQYGGDPIHAGRGGDAGSIGAAAGNGAPSCDGGRTEALLGRPGESGLDKGNGTEPPRGGKKLPYGDITLRNGGNGGGGEDRNHAAGDGGLVVLGVPAPRKNHPRDPPGNSPCCYFRHIVLAGYANGGAGFSGCTSSAATNGTDGGGGARLYAGQFQGALRGFPELPQLSLRATGSFNGGPGGDGNPAGDGGRPGTMRYEKHGSRRSFQPGANGKPCSGTTGQDTPPSVNLGAAFYPESSTGACENQPPDFVNHGETCYTIHASDPDGDPLSYGWSQIPPVQDTACTDFHPLAPPLGPGESVWHHGDQDGCNHAVEGPDGHEGVVFATVTDGHYTCVAPYLGTNSGEFPVDAPCSPSSKDILTVVKPYVGSPGPGQGGTVESASGQLVCGPTCQIEAQSFAPGDTVTLTATPSGGWVFKGWQGASCSGTGATCTITMQTNEEVTATFAPS